MKINLEILKISRNEWESDGKKNKSHALTLRQVDDKSGELYGLRLFGYEYDTLKEHDKITVDLKSQSSHYPLFNEIKGAIV